MEYKRLRIEFGVDAQTEKASGLVTTFLKPSESERSKAMDKVIVELLKQGWKIESTTPITSTMNALSNGTIMNYTYTSAIEVFLTKI